MQQPPYPPAQPRRRGPSALVIVLIVFAVLAVLAIPVIAVVAALLLPAFSQAREAAWRSACQRNVMQISQALSMYAMDWEQTLPPQDAWAELPAKYGVAEALHRCPATGAAAATGSRDYTFNAWLDALSYRDIARPSVAVLLFEADSSPADGMNPSSTREDSFTPRHSRSGGPVGVISYADGHVSSAPTLPPLTQGIAD